MKGGMSLNGLSAPSAKRNLTSLSSLHTSSTTGVLSALKEDATEEFVPPYAYWETRLMSFRAHFLKCPACSILQRKKWIKCVLCEEEFTPILHSAPIKYFVLEDDVGVEHIICQNKTCISRARISNKILIANNEIYRRAVPVG